MRELLTKEQAEAIRSMSARLGGSPILNALAFGLGPIAPEARPPPIAVAAPGASTAPDSANADADALWARKNLRWSSDKPVLDLANILRILDRHPDYAGRFCFSKGMGKVCDRGKVMLAWQIDELAAGLQERFLPGISEDSALKAVSIVANRSSAAAA